MISFSCGIVSGPKMFRGGWSNVTRHRAGKRRSKRIRLASAMWLMVCSWLRMTPKRGTAALSEFDTCLEAEHRRVMDVRLGVRPEHVLEVRPKIHAAIHVDVVVDFKDHFVGLHPGRVVAERNPQISFVSLDLAESTAHCEIGEQQSSA